MDIKEKLLSYWNAFIALLKKGYFALEDTYYAFLDWLNQYIPIYKVIDPVDRHFPSFILFIIIIVGIIALLLMLLVFPFFFPPVGQSYTGTIVLIDAVSKEKLPGLDVSLGYLDKNESVKTGNFGDIEIMGLFGATIMYVKVMETKIYKGLETIIELSGEDPYTLKIEGKIIGPQGIKTIIVKDRTTNAPIQNKAINIDFSCSSGGVEDWSKQSSTYKYIEDVPPDCGTMRANVKVSGYEEQEKDLVNDTTTFLLNPEAPPTIKGTIAVYVKSASDEEAISGISIYLYTDQNVRKNAGISDSMGSYAFEVAPGSYFVQAIDDTGAYAPEKSETEQVNANGLVKITLLLEFIAPGDRLKLLARLVDSSTNKGVSDAEFKLFIDNAEIKSYTSDANGFVVVKGIEEDDELSAVITHPDYVTEIVDSLQPIKETENTATVIQLVRAYRPACGNGVVELGESCDSNQLNNMTCSAFGFPSGNLKCSTSTCQLDTSDCVAQPSCGNGIIDLGETCDTQGPNFDNKTCSSFDDFSGGELSCSSSCQISTSSCTGGNGTGICGDGNVNIGETCDILGPNLDGKACIDFDDFLNGALECRSGCTLNTSNCIAPPKCGNGLIDPGETCDKKGPEFNNLQCDDFDEFTGGSLNCTDSCTVDTSSCTDGPEVNVGSIIISVADESAEAVEGADAYLFNSAYPNLILEHKITDSEGKTEEFENLPEGKYFAEASNENGDGQSSEKDLVLNQTIELPVVLTLGESSIEVYVTNTEGQAVEGAAVDFYESTDDRQIQRATTDSTGKAETSLRVNLNPYIVVSATGYLPYTTSAITLAKDNIVKIYVTLVENIEAEDALDIKIAGVYDALLNGRKVTQLASGSEYYFRFNVIVPTNSTHDDVIAHIRTDLDTILDASDSEMKFWIKAISVSGASAIKSATFDPSDPYSNQNIVYGDAKQANISFGNLDAGVYEFYARTYIKSSLPNDTLIELHYSAKSNEYSTDSLLEQYYIGRAFCTDCTFAYAFSLNGTSIDPNATTELLQDTDYDLGYEIYNASDVDYDDVTAGFSDSANALILSPTSDSIGSIGSKTTVSSSISMRARAEVSLTQLLMQLSPNVSGNSATANFKVLAKNPMVITPYPKYLYPNVPNQLTIVVSDGAGHPIEGALVKLSYNADYSDPFSFGNADAGGIKRFNIDPLEEEIIIYIRAEKPNYITAEASVEVQNVIYPPPEADFSCITVDDMDADEALDIGILKGWSSKSFKISTSECLEAVSISIASELSVSQNQDCSNAENILPIDMLNTDSKTFCILADKLLGEYPVYVNAKFASSTEYSNIAELTVYVPGLGIQDPSSNFSINKTTFDLLGQTDSGVITNYVPISIRDFLIPAITAESILLGITVKPELPATKAFSWRIKTEAMETITITQTLTEPITGWQMYTINMGDNTTEDIETPIVQTASNIRFVVIDQMLGTKDTGGEEGFYDYAHIVPGSTFEEDETASGEITIYTDAGTETYSTPCKDLPAEEPLTCDWQYDQVLNSKDDANPNESIYCPMFYPCRYSYFEINLGSEVNLENITAEIQNEEAMPMYSVYGTVIGTKLSINPISTYKSAESELRQAEISTSSQEPQLIGALDFNLTPASDAYLSDINYFVLNDSDGEVETFIQGKDIYAIYKGPPGDAEGDIDFDLMDIGLPGTTYGVLDVIDYVAGEAK